MSVISVEDYVSLREQLKGAGGEWYDGDTIPPIPLTPILSIIEGGEKANGKTRVYTVLIYKNGQWHSRYVLPGMVGVEEPLPNDVTIMQWKKLDAPLPGFGLRGEYFNNISLSGHPAAVKYSNVDFNWNGVSPIEGLGSINYSVRWTGTFEVPETGEYRFRTLNDDGVRLWVDDNLIIDDWNTHGATLNTSLPVTLVQGFVPIKLEYFQGVEEAEIHLYVATPESGATLFSIIPTSSLYISDYSL